MEVVPPLKRDFGQEHFSAAQLGDKRRTRRLCRAANRLLERPTGTLPRRMNNHAELTALYRLMDCPAVTHGSVLEAHRQKTLRAMGRRRTVLILHDATELDYTSKKSLQKLGQIGKGGRRGYICHNSLAITPDRQVLGLANQILHCRRTVPAGESGPAKRLHPRRESRLWVAACQSIGQSPDNSLWIDIADRGSDTFEFIAFQVLHRRPFVIRCAHDRNLAGEDHVAVDRIHHKLKGYTRDLPELGRRTVHVPAVQSETLNAVKSEALTAAAGKPKAREASVRVAAGPVSVNAPDFARGEQPEGSLDLWVIHVRETQAPPDAEALEWILLTNLPTRTFEQACEKVDFYACRPVIEEYHKGQKTGASVQQLQFEQEERLEPMIALLSIVTAVLLQLRQLAREAQAHQTPASQIVPVLYGRVLSAERTGTPRDDLSVYEFCMMLGGLGGHLGRKGDGFPGWLTLWRGWADLMLMVKGVDALRGKDV